MAADDDTYSPTKGVSDTRERVAGGLSWRRVLGGVVMVVGLLLVIFFLALALVVTVTFVEWRNALDGLRSVAIVSVPPMLAGLALLALGRWIYGGWRIHTPIRKSASFALPFAGVLAAFAAITMFFWALFDETGRGGVWALGPFAVSLIASGTLIVVGLVLRCRRAQI